MKLDLSTRAVASLRALPAAQRRAVAARLDVIADAAPAEGDAEADGFVIEVADVEVVCVRCDGERLLVASIEPARADVTGLLYAPVGRMVERLRPDREPAGPRKTRRVRGLEPRRGRIRLMDLLLETKLAARALRRDAGIVLLAIVVLGVGIGLPAAMFGLVDAMIRRGLPVDGADRIMHLERQPEGASGEGWGVSPRELEAWREQQRSFESLEALTGTDVTVRIGNATSRHAAERLTGGAFQVLRTTPALGRTLTEEDTRPGAEPVVVLSDALWRSRAGADPSIVGSIVSVDGVAHTVIGVMPPGFAFPSTEELWLPYSIEAAMAADPTSTDAGVFGRLADGVDLADARAEFAVIAERLETRWPDTNENMGIAVKPITERYVGANPVRTMYVVLAAVMLVLVVACANVANLLLVRAVRRTRDMAVRAALGAGRARLAYQTLLESALLAMAGGAIALGVASISLGLFRRAFGDRMPYWVEFRLSGSVLLFMLGLTVFAALLAGLLPALRAGGGDLQSVLRDESRGSTGVRVGRIMRALVVVEMALSVALLAATGLLARSAREAEPDQLGLPWRDVLYARVALADGTPADARVRYYEELETTLAAQPDVNAVTIATTVPATRSGGTRVAVENTTYESYERQPYTRRVAVTPSFFDVWETDAVRGRTFEIGDDADGAPVVIVNTPLARQLFGDADPVGRRIRLGSSEEEPWRVIVGVVPALWAAGLDSSPERNPAAVYVPLAQSPPQTAAITLRTRGAPLAAVPVLRDVVSSIDADVPLFAIADMATVVRDNSWFYGMAASIFALCGLATLLLATAGLYGVIAFSVSQRTREFGIRMAMGAQARDILRLVVRRGSVEILIGLAAGMLLATLIARGVSSLLFGVRPGDPLVLGGTVALLAIVAAGAMLIPAGRAARSDPLDALRAE